MPPRGVKSSKRKRQYEHIKESAEARGNPRAEEIAARTVNKQRAQAGETKGKRKGRKMKRSSSSRKSSGRKTASRGGSSRSSSASRKRSTKKSRSRGRKK